MCDFCFLFDAAFIKYGILEHFLFQHFMEAWEMGIVFSVFFCLCFKQKAKSMIKHCCADCVHFEYYFHWLLSSAVLGHR